jgi:ribose/xylose/arabinose/galactoside ABC-type transport system permease subunit
MMRALQIDSPYFRPLVILLSFVFLLTLLDKAGGQMWSLATAFTTLETFASAGLVALGLGLTMIIREFDLSIVGVFSLAGCIAVIMGQQSPATGLIFALLAGILAGATQGYLIVKLRIGSVGVTLGGLLIFAGIAYVISENRSIAFENMPFALSLTAPLVGLFSIRSIVTISIFVLVAIVFATTRYGREVIAVGSDERAARIAGVKVDRIVIVVFAFSGFCGALAGALLSFSLATASPSGLTDIIPPAAAAAILGGVSLSGGQGRPLGIAIGVLSLSVLRSGMNAIGAPSYVNDIEIGIALLIVAFLDGPLLTRRVQYIRARAKEFLQR